MASSAPTPPLRKVLETRLSQLTTEVESLFSEARERGRREVADQLNQAVRRLRQSEDRDGIAATLVDAALGFAAGAGFFCLDGTVARGERIRGVPGVQTESFRSLAIPLSSAAALAGAVETRDPVTAATTASEVSQELIRVVGHPAEGRASVFPLVTPGKVVALLYVWGTVEGAALEVLSQVAADAWAAMEPAPPPPEPVPDQPELVQIAAAPKPAWDSLPPEEQRVHLRAQRFARVQVSEMRLYHSDAVQTGRSRRDIYGALRKAIDAARDGFRDQFFVSCPSMVDYLHLEILRTLANDDADLLGKDYPGPML